MKGKLSLSALALTLTLASCGGGGTGGTTDPTATSGTINGLRVIDDNTYQFGFTPLNGTAIVTTANLNSVTVTNLSAGQASASVCGQVTGQDAVTASISLDSTGSMSNNDPNELRKTAAESFVSRMSTQDKAAVLSFDTYTTPSSGLLASKLWQNFTADKALLNTAIANATFDGGGTAVFDAVVDGSLVVKQSGGANPKVLVLTDGEDNASDNTAAQAIAAANANGTPVYVIGLDAYGTVDFTEMQDIASGTGGLFQKAGDAAQLQDFFDKMYNAFRAQGCVQLNFTQKPATGTVVTGNLNVVVQATGKAASTVTAPFSVTVR